MAVCRSWSCSEKTIVACDNAANESYNRRNSLSANGGSVLAAMVGFLAMSGGVEIAPMPHAPTITRAQSIRLLTAEECASRRRVRLTGVVTFVNHTTIDDFFIQDDSAGIYVSPSGLTDGLKLGDRVVVEGFTDPGDFAPCVVPTNVTKLESGVKLPVPIPFNLMAEDGRWLDSQAVMAWGVLADVSSNEQFTILTLMNTYGRAAVLLPDPKLAAAYKTAMNTPMRISGVCVPSFDRKTRTIRVDYTRIYTNAAPMISLIPTDSRVVTVSELLDRFLPFSHPGARRIRMSGIVVAISNRGTIYVQNGTEGFGVRADHDPGQLSIGDYVEATGLITIEARRVRLIRSTVQVMGTRELPEPIVAKLDEIIPGQYFGCRVLSIARVEEVIQRDQDTVVVLVDGSHRLEAIVPSAAKGIEPGSRVRIIGVSGRQHAPTQPTSDRDYLWVSDVSEIVVVEAPPNALAPRWWTTERMLAAAGMAALMVALVAAWVFTLRRRVARQTRLLCEEYEAKAVLEDKLRNARRLEAIGRLAGGIAHDFNNLLTVINGCGELLQNELPTDTAARELASDIRKAGDKAASLVAQLLMFSRQQSMPLATLSLNDAVLETERILKRVIGEKITVDCRTDPTTPVITAEPTLIQQIILNLAVNARDAMPKGGTLRIRTARAGVTTAPLARLTIADTGIGMDSETMARIFEPFFTTKGIGEGTGLGLATVYGIVQTLNGEIRCQSVRGEGTTFEIDFPSADASVIRTEDQPSSFVRGRGRILVAEDDSAVRDLTTRVLETAGYEVLTAESPLHALKVARSENAMIDLLLTDLVMPGMNGRELADVMQSMRPSLRVLYMTGYSDDEFIRAGVDAGQIALINKPFTPAALSRKVDEILRAVTASSAS
jgi:two-component system, cell cycle sensor histidine kinase and response regulator CckA